MTGRSGTPQGSGRPDVNRARISDGSRNEIGLLAAGVGHQLDNALQVVIGHSELLTAGVLGEQARKLSAQTIRDTAERASKLIEKLILFSRSRPLKPQTFEAPCSDPDGPTVTPELPAGDPTRERREACARRHLFFFAFAIDPPRQHDLPAEYPHGIDP